MIRENTSGRKSADDDILADFAGRQRRFAYDVKQMNEVVLAANLPPLIAIVLDQFPVHQGRGYRVARIAEEAFARAGAEVIPSEPFYRAYSGRDFSVSRWVEHPNEEANWLWAEMISDALRHGATSSPLQRPISWTRKPRRLWVLAVGKLRRSPRS